MREHFSGMVLLELTGADTARTLGILNESAVAIYRPRQQGDLTVSFWIPGKDVPKVAAICEKRGDKLACRKKQGLCWTLLRLLLRPVLVTGLAVLMALSLFLPSRVLFIRVEGNETIPARKILETAEGCGVGFGASRRQVRSEKVKNALLGAIPELQWAGVNTTGCTAVISVRERSAPEEAAVTSPKTYMAASRDGFILSVNVTRGTGLVRPGEVVRTGQTLISGYTDCGLCIRATGAEGEIFAETRRDFRAVTPADWSVRVATGEIKRKYSLLLQKKRINLWKDSGICDATCGRMYEEYFLTLPGGFRLPVALCVESFPVSRLRPAVPDLPGTEAALRAFADACLRSRMVSGQIRSARETVSRENGLFLLEGTYDCTEMIGRVRQIGDTNGKRD